MRERKIKRLTGNEDRQGHHRRRGDPTGHPLRSPVTTDKGIHHTDHNRGGYAEKQDAQEYKHIARSETGSRVGNADGI